MRYFLWLLPAEHTSRIAAMLIMAGGFAIPQKRIAVSLFLAAVGIIALPPLMKLFIEEVMRTASADGGGMLLEIPWWTIASVAFIVLLLLLRGLLAIIIGRNAANDTIGILAADVIRHLLWAIFLCPWVLLRVIFRAVFR